MSDNGRPQDNGELDEAKRLTLEEYANSARNMALVTRKEALERGLKFYWNGTPCPKGHYSKRRAKGSGCVACLYIAASINNKLMIARRSAVRKAVREEKKAEMDLKKIGPEEKQIVLERYSETGDLEQGAIAIGLTMAELNVQISRSASFAVEVFALEKRLRAAGVRPKFIVSDVVWTPEKKALLIRVYVDTGLINVARDTIGASPTNLHDELKKDPEFAQALKDATPRAEQALEEKAAQLAIQGDEKLLTLILKAKKPEYREKIQIDQTTTIRLSEEQLTERIGRLVNKYRIIDAEFTEPRLVGKDESAGQRRLTQDTGSPRVATDAEQVPLHVSRLGSTSS